MLLVSTDFFSSINAPVRRIKAGVEMYSGDTLAATFTQNDALKSFEIERIGETSKFFGFPVTHKVKIHLRDVDRVLDISTANSFKIRIGVVLPDSLVEYVSFPKVYVTEVNRDENTNELSITAYDKLDVTTEHTVSELELTAPYSIRDFVNACGSYLGLTVNIPDDIAAFDTVYNEGANFEGTELIKEGLTAAAEATQTIYYINSEDELNFQRLDKDGDAVAIISKSNYITLDTSSNRRLQTICHATELGDNVSAGISAIGTTQYVRNNPFWDMREDVATLVINAKDAMCGITINQFECEWRGNPALEIGDKIGFITKDDNLVSSYLLNDTISYDGGYAQDTEWSYTEDNGTTPSNPATLGEVLKQTYARVDKANKNIEILTKEQTTNKEDIASLKLNTDSIAASVSKMETDTHSAVDLLNQDIATLTKQVEATITAEDVQLEISSKLANGVSTVTTTTGFTFNEAGLTISKTGREMTTNIDEDGMSIFRNDVEVLTADNQGVIATDLHARTFLIVGGTSRFENYDYNGEARTGCFWIG